MKSGSTFQESITRTIYLGRLIFEHFEISHFSNVDDLRHQNPKNDVLLKYQQNESPF